MITIALAVENKALWTEVHSCLEQESVQISHQQAQVGDMGLFVAGLERSKPDVILIDVSVLRETLPDVISKARAAAPGAMIVALNTTDVTGPVIECFRAGADEYLFPPLAAGLQKALHQREAEQWKTESAKLCGKVVVFLSAKGGCGATTLACHAAAELARLGQRVLLADLDINVGMVAFLMKSKSSYSILDALKNTYRLDASYWRALVSKGIPNLEIISAPTSLAAKQIPKEEEVRQVLSFTRSQYQWTMADAGRGITKNTMTAFESADEACLITTPEIPALSQTKLILQTLVDGGFKEDRLRLILNRVCRRSGLQADEVQQMLGISLFAVLHESYGELHEAYSDGQLLPAKSDLGKSIGRMARKLAGIEEPKSKQMMSFFGSKREQ